MGNSVQLSICGIMVVGTEKRQDSYSRKRSYDSTFGTGQIQTTSSAPHNDAYQWWPFKGNSWFAAFIRKRMRVTSITYDPDGVKTIIARDGNGELLSVRTKPQRIFKTATRHCCNSSSTPNKRAKIETNSAAIEAKSADGEDLPVLLDGEECTICYEPYRRVEDMTFLPCAHYFHKDCVDKWLAIDYTCPFCRRDAANDRSV